MVWCRAVGRGRAGTQRQLLAATKIQVVRLNLARRIAGLENAVGLRTLVQLLGRSEDVAVRRDVLDGIRRALEGRRQALMPEGWAAVYPKLVASGDSAVREQSRALAVQFGDRQALVAMRRLVATATAPAAERRSALLVLVDHKDPELLPILEALLEDRELRGPAIRGLAAYDAAAIPRLLLSHYAALTAEEKADVVQTLAARPGFALSLLDALERGAIPRRDVSAFVVRQLQALKNPRVNDRVKQVWGEVRPASQAKAALMAKYKAELTPEALQAADLSRGRLLFSKTWRRHATVSLVKAATSVPS